jgi:hypothetical protein
MTEEKQKLIVETKERLKVKLSLPVVKLDLCCGLHHRKPIEEFIHHDGHPNELTEVVSEFGDLPFEDETFDYCEAGDCIEHIVGWRTDEVLREWNRVMKIGSVTKFHTPNLHRCCVDYTNGKMNLKELMQNLYGWQNHEYQSHYTLYTVESLSKVLTDYGYGDFDFSEALAWMNLKIKIWHGG